MKTMLGVDIGGTKCAVISGRLQDGTVEILNRVAFPTEAAKGPDQAIAKITNALSDFINDPAVGNAVIQSIGISCGSPLDSRKGLILSPPNLPGWDNIPIVELFEKRFTLSVRLMNDANACALAEWKYGAAKGCRNVVFLTFGTGMGAGLILDGRLYSGTNDLAGEVGHMRLSSHGPVGYGKTGSFEGFCSGGGIAQLARSMVLEKLQTGEKVAFCPSIGELDNLTAKTVGDAAESGDLLAAEIYHVCGEYLGKGIAVIIDILNPEIIVIGSIYARSTGLLHDAMMGMIEKEALSLSRKACRIVPAALGEQLGDYAALAVAADIGTAP